MSSFTSGQSVALAVTPKVSSFLSIVSSTWIVVEVMTQPTKRRNTYNRLLLMMSVCDLSTTIWYFMSTWPIPVNSTPPVAFAVGNEATCTAQGFFLQTGIWSPIYNCCLAFYYLLAVKYYSVPSVKDEQTLRRIEYGMHAVPLVVGISTALAGVFLKLYNNANLWCWIAPVQQQQQQEEDACEDLSSSSSCPGLNSYDNNALVYRWAFYFGPLWLCIVVATGVMVFVYQTVRRKELSHLSMIKSARSSVIAAQEATIKHSTNDKDSDSKTSSNIGTKKKPTHTRYRSFAPMATAAAAQSTGCGGGGENDRRRSDNRPGSVSFQEEERPKLLGQSGDSNTNKNNNLVTYGASQHTLQQRQHIRRESRQMNDFFRAMTDVDLFDAVDDAESSRILKAIVTGTSSRHLDLHNDNSKEGDRRMDENKGYDDDYDDETEYVLQTIESYISANEQASSSEMGSFGSRAVFRQSLYYTLGFYMTFLFATVNRILQQVTGKTYFPIILLHSFFIPLQGLFNLLVYRYYFFNRLRQRNPHMHFWELLSQTFRWTFLGPRQDKECSTSDKRTISVGTSENRSHGNIATSARSTSTWATISPRISSLSNRLSPRQSKIQGMSSRDGFNAKTSESLKSNQSNERNLVGLDTTRVDQSELRQDHDVANILHDDVMGSYNYYGLENVVNLPQIDEDDDICGQMAAAESGNSSKQHHENLASGRLQSISVDEFSPVATQFPIFVKGDSFEGQTTPGFEDNLEFSPRHRYINTVGSSVVEYTKEKVDDDNDGDDNVKK